ncbi:MAG TPA: hypothetical protein DSN98_07785 [Thermoplasmata archaeon]|jgi:hypothetical protein|nr:MAG TPA: hypothetical protein DSN98_07785 [Thermoplasmata archaeon]
MRLPVPIFRKDTIYTECVLVKPKPFVIANTNKTLDQTGNFFDAMRQLLNGCIKEFKTSEDISVSDEVGIKTLIPKLPYKSAEYLGLLSVAFVSPEDDGIEGVYDCPRCRHRIISEHYQKDGLEYDTRDFLSKLNVSYYESESGEQDFEFSSPVQIVDKASGNIAQEISSITMKMPTLESAINAFTKMGTSDRVRLQLAQFAEAIVAVNHVPVDNKWRNNYGLYVLENPNDMEDVYQISRWINQYGLDSTVEKTCSNCGKVWRPVVNTSNFFASGLQSL